MIGLYHISISAKTGEETRMPLTAEEIEARQPTKEQVIAQYESSLDEMLDKTAQSLTFKDRHSLALRAAYPNHWQQLGIAFGVWMDGINAQSWQLLCDVLAGNKQAPTLTEYMAMFQPFQAPE